MGGPSGGRGPGGVARTAATTGDAAWRAIRALPLLFLLPLAVLGLALFWVPREFTGWVAGKAALAEGEDAVPTFRVLYGAVVFIVWFLVLGIVASFTLGALGGLTVFLSLPPVAFGALVVGDSRRLSWGALRRLVVLRTQRERIAKLRTRQRRLAGQLRELFERAVGQLPP